MYGKVEIDRLWCLELKQIQSRSRLIGKEIKPNRKIKLESGCA